MEKQTRIIMGMPITVSVESKFADTIDAVFAMFCEVDTAFSTYKENSEISRLNRLEIEQKM